MKRCNAGPTAICAASTRRSSSCCAVPCKGPGACNRLKGRLRPTHRPTHRPTRSNAMLERADHWTPPDSLGYSSLRPVRLTGQGKALIGITAALVIGAIVLGVFLGGVARRQAEEQRL